VFVCQGLVNNVMETEKMICCFSALPEAGLGERQNIIVVKKPFEATHDHFFEKFANVACQRDWTV